MQMEQYRNLLWSAIGGNTTEIVDNLEHKVIGNVINHVNSRTAIISRIERCKRLKFKIAKIYAKVKAAKLLNHDKTIITISDDGTSVHNDVIDALYYLDYVYNITFIDVAGKKYIVIEIDIKISDGLINLRNEQ